MKTQSITTLQAAHAIQLTRRILDEGLEQLPHDITERLRVIRVQALTARQRSVETVGTIEDDRGFFGWLQRMPGFTRGLIAVPVLAMALLIGKNIYAPIALSPKIAIHNLLAGDSIALVQPKSALETIDIDAILNEKIPLQAYLNEDFNQLVEQTVLQNRANLLNKTQLTSDSKP